MTKYCYACKEEKDISEFFKNKSKKDGYAQECKKCRKKYSAKYNRERYQKMTKDEKKESGHKQYEYVKKKLNDPIYWQHYRKSMNDANKRYREKHKKQEYERSKAWKYAKRKTDYQTRINLAMSSGINASLKKNGGSKNNRHCFDMVNYNSEELIKHLESLFEEGMSWDNYGRGPNDWSIDHIIPKSKFIYSDFDDYEFQMCWALENLRPMWHIDNMAKHDKIICTDIVKGK